MDVSEDVGDPVSLVNAVDGSTVQEDITAPRAREACNAQVMVLDTCGENFDDCDAAAQKLR